MKQKKESSPEELLRVEGIGAKGFGIIPRYAMCDPDLGWSGKVLYAYLCALAGSGSQTWPKRETTILHLKIGKDTYYKAQKELTSQGYITIETTRRGNRQGVNVYTLVVNPPKIRKRTKVDSLDDRMTSRVRASGLKAGGYGMLPRLVMIDDRLCAKTKLVYAYITSYAGAGCSAFPNTAVALAHLNLSKDAWRKAIRELSQTGYLSVSQRRVKGRFDVYDYILLEHPNRHGRSIGKGKRIQPETEKKDTETSPETGLPDTGFKDTETSPETGLPDTGFKDTEALPEADLPDAGFKDTETPPEADLPDTGFKDTEISPEEENKDTETPPEAGLPDAGFKDTYLATVLSSSL